MVGVHRAGMVWSGFLPSSQEQHGGTVEMFGGDQLPGNGHYHNILSLVDIHY